LKEKSDVKKPLKEWRKAGALQANIKIKAMRSDNAPALVERI
jgi:hypothetical protein